MKVDTNSFKLLLVEIFYFQLATDSMCIGRDNDNDANMNHAQLNASFLRNFNSSLLFAHKLTNKLISTLPLV